MSCRHAIHLGLSNSLHFPNNHSFNSVHSALSCSSCFLLSHPPLRILLRPRSPCYGSLFILRVQWEHNASGSQITKQNNGMETSIPQPTLRFLTSGISKRIIWNKKDAISTHRLSVRTRSPLHSFHNPLSLLFPLPPHPSFLSPVLRPPPRFLCNMTDTQSSPTKTVRVVVKGRVQGVFYRNWTIENATQLGLKGWVRNRRDGSVEALFSGNPDSVKEMEQRCRHGPPDAVVTGLQVFPSNDNPAAYIYDLNDLPEDVKKGHFLVHTFDDGELNRFIVQLDCLAHPGFLKLLKQVEEEFRFKQVSLVGLMNSRGFLRT